MSVPPLPSIGSRNLSAFATFSGVFRTGAGKHGNIEVLKPMSWNVSSGFMLAIQYFIVSFAFAIGQPDCEPVWSITKTISFGDICALGGASGGWITIVK